MPTCNKMHNSACLSAPILSVLSRPLTLLCPCPVQPAKVARHKKVKKMPVCMKTRQNVKTYPVHHAQAKCRHAANGTTAVHIRMSYAFNVLARMSSCVWVVREVERRLRAGRQCVCMQQSCFCKYVKVRLSVLSQQSCCAPRQHASQSARFAKSAMPKCHVPPNCCSESYNATITVPQYNACLI